MEYQKDVIVVDRLGVIRTDIEEEYLAHLLCLRGTCRYRFNERDFELHPGDLSIIRKRKNVGEDRAYGQFSMQNNLCEARFHRVMHTAK